MDTLTNNGRVDIKSPNTSNLFQLYDKIPTTKIKSSNTFFCLNDSVAINRGE